MSDTTTVAVFGDLHGHLRIMLQLCRIWQETHSLKLDGVLLCGDLGFFPDETRIDRATKKFAKRDPEELGFSRYFARPAPQKPDPLVERLLNSSSAESIECPIVFCHGNHEDFEALREICDRGSAPFFVDAYDRFEYLPSGTTYELSGLRIASLGGSPEQPGASAEPIAPHVSRKLAGELQRAQFDVLLTHGGPSGIGSETDECGSDAIRRVIESAQPAYNVFAHHGKPIPRTHIGSTDCVWFNDVTFQPARDRSPTGPIEPTCMGILTWHDHDAHELKIVDEDWFKRFTGRAWQHFGL